MTEKTPRASRKKSRGFPWQIVTHAPHEGLTHDRKIRLSKTKLRPNCPNEGVDDKKIAMRHRTRKGCLVPGPRGPLRDLRDVTVGRLLRSDAGQ